MRSKATSMVSVFFILLVISIGMFPGTVWSDIPPHERAALIALHQSTWGFHWRSDVGWLDPPLHTDGYAMPGTEKDWRGITCDPDNTRVIGIDLSFNDMRGPLPAELGNLSHLEFLVLEINRLNGEIPKELGNLQNLEKLALNYNQLSGVIPPELGKLLKLKQLRLFSNQLTGQIPMQLGNLTNLEELALNSNQLTGPIPTVLGNLLKLKQLDLSYNQLTGPIPTVLKNLIDIEALSLSSNQLAGIIPKELGNLSKLDRLKLSSNQLTGSIPTELGNISKLKRLELSSNQLTGPIPHVLGNLLDLKWLELYSNQLTGSIPPVLGNLSELQGLFLSYNRLTGHIPPELGNLSMLNSLHLDFNCLDGNIPLELSSLSNLFYLYLSSNQLMGNIPPELTNLSNLIDNYSDFRWNRLYTDDESVKVFLDSKQIGGFWEETQTIAPTDLNARGASPTSVEVSWTPIAYSDDKGSYRVYYSKTSGGPYNTFGGATTSKHDDRLEIKGLERFIHYYFMVKTRTEPHQYNQNTLVSGRSVEVSSGTQGSDKMISGRVFEENGKGVEGVTLTFSPSEQFETTDVNGYYEHPVKDGWIGTVTPDKIGYQFEPDKIEFENVTSHQSRQDFKASLIPQEIKGRVTSGIEGIEGITLTFTYPDGETEAKTDINGEYRHEVPYGWIGSVKPSSKDKLKFYPSYREYGEPGVTQNMDNQGYQLSVSITLQVSRKKESTMIIRKEYGEIDFNVNFIGISPGIVKKFAVLRKETDGEYEHIKEFPAQEPYRFTYIDKYLDKGKNYYYMGIAMDDQENVIGLSKGKNI